MKRTLQLATVGFWAVMVLLLVRKQSSEPGASVARLPEARLTEHDEWFGVYRDGRKIGHAHRITARTAGGYAFDEESAFSMAMLGTPQSLRTSLHTETDQSFTLQSFRFALLSPATSFSAQGESDGKQLVVTYGAAGQAANHLTLPLKEPISLPSTLRPRILAAHDPPGTTYTLPVFNPLTMQNAPMTVTVEGRETVAGPDGPVETVRLAEEHHGVRARAWIESDGTVLREEAALGFTLERESREKATARPPGDAPVDLALSSRIPLEGRVVDPRNAERLTLRMGGPAAARVPDDPPRQRVSADLLSISRETVPDAQTLADEASAARDATLAPYLAPSPFIESDDPGIVAAAREAVGDERDATAAARRLVAWVNEYVRKEPSLTIPSAREVLQSRRGDCNEHAVLLTALARAAGIPARMVAGAMLVENAFFYHAWTELWLGRWISADAVFNQLPTDVTHVKLADGSPEHMMDLAGTIGNLTFRTEEAQR
jgi:hypothetical protein